MRAFHMPAAGAAPILGDLPIPAVAPGQVLVKVKAAGLNPVDNFVAAGMMADYFPHEYPLVLGRDAAGVVEAVGEGVDHVSVGDAVFGHILFTPPVQAGTLAEYALMPATGLNVKPVGLDFVAAAALPLSSAAAIAVIDVVDPQPGQVVLINGATGGVGSYAIQLLAARGVTVVATSTDADRERLTKLGATTVVDYTAGSVADQVRAAYPNGVDGLVNLTGYSADDVPLAAVRAGGKVGTSTMAPDQDTLAAAGLTGASIAAQPVRETTGPLAEQAAAGTLTIDVDTVLPLEEAAAGLATPAAGLATPAAGTARGKIVVKVCD